jgi:hypothetical protein
MLFAAAALAACSQSCAAGDTPVVQQLTSTLKALKASGMTILLVEQNVHLALALSGYAYVIPEGLTVHRRIVGRAGTETRDSAGLSRSVNLVGRSAPQGMYVE